MISKISSSVVLFFLGLLILNGCIKSKVCDKGTTNGTYNSSTISLSKFPANDTFYCTPKLSSKDYLYATLGKTYAERSEISASFFNGFKCTIKDYNTHQANFNLIDTMSVVVTCSDQSVAPIVHTIVLNKDSSTTYIYECHDDLLKFPAGSSYVIMFISRGKKNNLTGTFYMDIELNSYINYCYQPI